LNLPFQDVDWSAKNSDVGRFFLEHVLMTSDILVSLQQSLSQSHEVELVHENEIPLPPKVRNLAIPFQWRVEVSSRLMVGVVPDAVFAIRSKSDPENVAFYFLEADRGTMPVARQSLTKSSFFRKLLAYEATWTQNIHKTRFAFNRFRVLTVTSSRERARNLTEAARQLNRGKGIFLFTDLHSFLAQPHGAICSAPDGTSKVAIF
jgi:hypothetical protein